MYESITELLRQGAAEPALEAAREAVAANPQDTQAHRLLSAALRLARQPQQALEAIEQAIALAPEDASLHLERGLALLGTGQAAEAGEALATSTGLDPNRLASYVIQAQLALARGDMDEARRLANTAARVSEDHPHVAAVQGAVALRTGEAEKALKILGAAATRHPDDPMVRHALGFAYLAQGHLAFAEQAFRGLLDRQPDSVALRLLLVDLLRRQQRPGDAAGVLAPVLDGPLANPVLRRTMGELQLAAGNHQAARDLLLQCVREQPGDRRALQGLEHAWRQLNQREEAASTLDTLLGAHPGEDELWQARLRLEPFRSAGGAAVIERWREARPDSPFSMEAAMNLHDVRGEHGAAEAMARRIVELQPGHYVANLRIIDALLRRDPDEAIAHVEGMLEQAGSDGARRNIQQLLGTTLDAAGRPGPAVEAWSGLHAGMVEQRQAPPPPGPARPELPPRGTAAADAPRTVFVWGLPGSVVDKVTMVLSLAGGPVLGDRMGPASPRDMFQQPSLVGELNAGRADTAALAAGWRDRLQARGLSNPAAVIDWLPWWDNALLHVLRPHMPDALLLVVLRDPRDMLLDWLAFGSPAPFAMATPEAGAQWLAQVLEHVAELAGGDLARHRVLRIDDFAHNGQALAAALSEALGTQVPPPPPGSLGSKRLPPGRWRAYREALGEAFAALAPVAERLGYPRD